MYVCPMHVCINQADKVVQLLVKLQKKINKKQEMFRKIPVTKNRS